MAEGFNYVRLDDDVSFQILRTNPKLTSNTKLVYDGENIYMDSYNASDQLNTMKYKNRSVNTSSLYNRALKNFLVGTGDNAYEVGCEMDDITIGRDYDLQFENMYWCGAESVNSDIYTQELGFVAPLYIRKKLPNYFVIFKVDGAANTNMNYADSGSEFADVDFDFNSDVLKKSTIIKTFDLREGTVMGDYIRRYVGQKDFVYDQSMYVNMSSQEVWFYGIDKSTGLLCKKVEKFDKSILNRDTTITYSDKWFTEGYIRNNLIYPYIINMEFLFDDNETPVYDFSRYFGIYCNDIDLFTTDVVSSNRNMLIVTDTGNVDELLNDGCIVYIKDKSNNLYEIKEAGNTTMTLGNSVEGNFDISCMSGYENESLSVTCFRAEDIGCASYIFTVNKKFEQGEGFSIYIDGVAKRFVGDYSKGISKGDNIDNIFSLNGNVTDISNAICNAINNMKTDNRVLNAFHDGNVVIIRSLFPGDEYNKKLSIVFDNELLYNRKVLRDREITNFYGGSSDTHNRFRIYTSDAGSFAEGRYVKTINGTVARIEYVSLYIDGESHVNRDYSEVFISNGKYVQMSKNHSIELMDIYSPSVGLLSMFPVKDFDFNTTVSEYGNDTDFKNQCIGLKSVLYDEYEGSGSDSDTESFIKYLDKDESITINDGTEKYEYVIYSDYNTIEIKYKDGDEEKTSNAYVWYYSGSGKTDKNNIYILEEDYEKLTSGNNISVYYHYKNDKDGSGYTTWDDVTVSYSPKDYKPIEIKEYTQDIVPNRMSDEAGRHIDSEYDYYVENYLPELCTVSKTAPYICKWSYYDNQKDGCGNPYRLNVSKIFGQNNLSPNVKAYLGRIENYTHHMPYYLNIGDKISKTEVFDNSDVKEITIDYYKELFSDTEVDYFDKIFNRKVNNTVGISSQLYSRYDFGDANTKTSCLFKGVKFIITPMENGIKTLSSKYNGYRFSMMYVPSSTRSFDNKITFVKNDTFKFIVGLIRFDIKVPSEYLAENIEDNLKENFTSAIAYAGCSEMLPKPQYITEGDNKWVKMFFINKDGVMNIENKSGSFFNIISIENYELSELIKTSYYMKNNDNDDVIRLGLKPVGYSINYDIKYSTIKKKDIQIVDGKIKITTSIYNENSFALSAKKETLSCHITFMVADEEGYIPGESKLYENYYSDFNLISAYGIAHNLDEENNVEYSSDDFKINIEAPSSIEAFDVMMSIPIEVNEKLYHQIGSVKISPKNINMMSTIYLNRYSGYYNPIYNDVIFFKDSYGAPYSNTGFDNEVEGFGYIKDMYFHKINKEYANTILSLSPYYPALNQYAIDRRDYNIFSSSWDKEYFTTQLDLNTYKREDNVCGMMNELCMFGSKYLHLPEEIYIDTLNGSTDWDDDYYKGSKNIEKEMMWKEIGTSTVNFYLFLHKRIVRYFIEETGLRETFSKYLNPEYSFGNTNTLDDDIEEYVEKNILKLYELNELTIWVKSRKMGVNDKLIDNDYVSALGLKDAYRKNNGFNKQTGASIQKLTTDAFDRKITYNMKSGCMETFGFSFKIKKI